MSSPESIPPTPVPRRNAGVPGQVAAAIIAVHAAGCAFFAVLILPAATKSATLSDTSHVMLSVFTAAFALALGFVARGLWHALTWPRTATVVWLLVLLPLGWAMVQAGRALVGALILVSSVVGIVAVVAESRDAAGS